MAKTIVVQKVKGRNPVTNEVIYYPMVKSENQQSIEDLAATLHKFDSQFSEGVIMGIARDLVKSYTEAFLAGDSVKVSGFGTYKLNITGPSNTDPDKITKQQLRISGITFVPDARMLAELNAAAQYQWYRGADNDENDAADTTTTPTTPSTDSGSDNSGSDNGDGPIITDHGVEF